MIIFKLFSFWETQGTILYLSATSCTTMPSQVSQSCASVRGRSRLMNIHMTRGPALPCLLLSFHSTCFMCAGPRGVASLASRSQFYGFYPFVTILNTPIDPCSSKRNQNRQVGICLYTVSCRSSRSKLPCAWGLSWSFRRRCSLGEWVAGWSTTHTRYEDRGLRARLGRCHGGRYPKPRATQAEPVSPQ